jgi:hypothetical protein
MVTCGDYVIREWRRGLTEEQVKWGPIRPENREDSPVRAIAERKYKKVALFRATA